jgi:hypothetical protein
MTVFKTVLDVSEHIDNKEVISEGISGSAIYLTITLRRHPELSTIIQIWPQLPQHIKAAIIALVQVGNDDGGLKSD